MTAIGEVEAIDGADRGDFEGPPLLRNGFGRSMQLELIPCNLASVSERYRRGVVAMANAGPNTNGSQFFIMHQNYRLPPAYVIFGKVSKGMEVVDALAETATARGPDGGMSQPLTPLRMKKVTIRP